jgi:hypothetical protein
MYGIIFNNSVHKNFYKSPIFWLPAEGWKSADERFIKPDLPFTRKTEFKKAAELYKTDSKENGEALKLIINNMNSKRVY